MAAKPSNPNDIGKSPIVQLIDETWRNGNSVVITGFLDGPFFENGMQDEWDDYRFRLYRTLALDDYIELRWGDVRWIENFTPIATLVTEPNGPANLERVTIWIDRNARVTVPSFLVGAIADQYMPHDDAAISLVRTPKDTDAFLAARSIAGCGSTLPGCGCGQ